MKNNDQPKKAGRPATGKKSSKPNITIANSLQDEARAAAGKRGVGYSEYVSIAINRQIAHDQAVEESDSKRSEFSASQRPISKRNAM